MRPVRIAAAVAIAVSVALGTTACATVSETTQKLAEEAEQKVSELTGGSVEVDAGDDVKVADDFPSEVPLVDAKLFTSTAVGTEGVDRTWTIVYSVADQAKAYADARQKLLDAGFTAEADVTAAEGSYGTFTTANYKVVLTAAPAIASEQPKLAYMVSRR